MAAVASQCGTVFGFLDLSKEIRIMIYERLPVQIKHFTLNTCHASNNNETVTIVFRCLLMSILATCRTTHDEAYRIIQAFADEHVAKHPPRLIYTGSEISHCSSPFFRFLYKALSLQALQHPGEGCELSPEVIKDMNKYHFSPALKREEYIAASIVAAVVHEQGLDSRFARSIKQGTAQLRMGAKNLEVVVGMRNCQREWSYPGLRWERALMGLDREAGRSRLKRGPGMTFAGFITELGYKGVPETDKAEPFFLGMPALRLEQMDEATWRNEWLDSD